jgi:hypothetical protein
MTKVDANEHTEPGTAETKQTVEEQQYGTSPADSFIDVLNSETEEIERRRTKHYAHEEQIPNPENLIGLALSGGGIRSATYSLGVLQALHRLKLLRLFDYLSTVSGGGFTGGWWSAWLSRKETDQGVNSLLFPPDEKIEFERPNYFGSAPDPSTPDSSASAGKDPIHHLRLFSNYLTPKKGLLSADTWRAVAVISRNLVLTWMVLIPTLLIAVLVSQFYFALAPEANITFMSPNGPKHYTQKFLAKNSTELHRIDSTKGARLGHDSACTNPLDSCKHSLIRDSLARSAKSDSLRLEYHFYLEDRLRFALWPIIAIIGWIVVLTVAWMQLVRNNSSSKNLRIYAVSMFCGSIVIAGASSLVSDLHFQQILGILQYHPWHLVFPVVLWIIGAIIILNKALRLTPRYETERKNSSDEIWRKDILRNSIVSFHAKLLVTLAFTAVILSLGGFGQDAVRFLVNQSSSQGAIGKAILKSGGWFAAIASIVGSIYTALASAPTGSGERGASTEKPGMRDLIFSVTPPLLLVVLITAAAWFSNSVLSTLLQSSKPKQLAIILSAVTGIMILSVFTIYEIKWIGGSAVRKKRKRILLGLCLLILLALIPLESLYSNNELENVWMFAWLFIAVLAGSFLLLRVATVYCERSVNNGRKQIRFLHWVKERNWSAFLICILVSAILSLLLYHSITTLIGHNPVFELPMLFSGAILLVLTILGYEAMYSEFKNVRTITTLSIVYLLLMAFQVLGFFDILSPGDKSTLVHLMVASIAILLGFVGLIGWMIDPNAISIHTFYRARLVRAYLGASNFRRSKRHHEITTAVAGDDIFLSELRNCDRGAPYHLIQATLNLVAGRDLSVAQRRAESFLLSKQYCGSLRTGFRPTNKYARNKLTLGTSLAISGAAASPNMGSKTPTGALVMLLTFFNIRLGFWAPTPNKSRWRSPQPRLWPYYMLKEMLSQTNEQTTYCYLTDGGHFDNTGLYALVERGCKYIILSDNGGDPKPCFEDLGNAIRRCRIDFGTDFDLDITPLFRDENDNASRHFIVGTMTYSQEHYKKLRRGDVPLDEERTGVIVVVKPTMTATEKVDVLQYKLQNAAFPNHSIADQWFTEAEFESYRKLGERSILQVFDPTFPEDSPTVDEDCQAVDELSHEATPNSNRNELEKLLQKFDPNALKRKGERTAKPKSDATGKPKSEDVEVRNPESADKIMTENINKAVAETNYALNAHDNSALFDLLLKIYGKPT